LTDNKFPHEMTVQEERAEYGKEKPRSKDTARLIWASKPKKEPNAKELEFQTAEEVYPNIAEKVDKRLDSFIEGKKEISERPNRLIWGDNLLVMQALLQKYEGLIDLIYIDPPFNTGENFNFPNEVKIGNTKIEKEMPISERLAYSDTWARGLDSFLDMLHPRLHLMRKLLSEKGSLFVHCDSKSSHYIKIILDEIFGREHFVNEIVWQRSSSGKPAYKNVANDADVIFWYCKTNNYTFNDVFMPLSETTIAMYKFNDEDGRGYYRIYPMMNPAVRPNLMFTYIDLQGKKWESPRNGWRMTFDKIRKMDEEGRLYKESNTLGEKAYWNRRQNEGKKANNIWIDIANLQGANPEMMDYPTQKPEKLIIRILEMASNKGDLVADFFIGSGTTAVAAEKMGRKWIASDLSKTAIQVTRGRLVNQKANPFYIQNLGNYQRQLVYSKEVNLKEMYNIILILFGASPRKDWQGFGVSKEDNKTLIYVCEPDRPMTGKKAIDLAKSAKTADGKGYKKLIILAWDYEYNFDEDFNQQKKHAKRDLADVEFKVIPSDVYKYLRNTKVGDQDLSNKITFYQKPYLRLGEPQIIERKSDEVQVRIRIEQYVVMDIPVKDESKRPEIERMLHKNFANLIDYWTIDWNYDGEVFRSTWQAIRDRKKPDPVTTSADSTLKKGKKYNIAVRVVDVFGNDASITKVIDLR